MNLAPDHGVFFYAVKKWMLLRNLPCLRGIKKVEAIWKCANREKKDSWNLYSLSAI